MHFDTSSSTLSEEGMRHGVLCAPAYICLVPGEGGGEKGEGRGREGERGSRASRDSGVRF